MCKLLFNIYYGTSFSRNPYTVHKCSPLWLQKLRCLPITISLFINERRDRLHIFTEVNNRFRRLRTSLMKPSYFPGTVYLSSVTRYLRRWFLYVTVKYTALGTSVAAEKDTSEAITWRYHLQYQEPFDEKGFFSVDNHANSYRRREKDNAYRSFQILKGNIPIVSFR